MTNDSASPERRRRPRTTSAKKTTAVAENLAEMAVEPGSEAVTAPATVDVTPSIPRSIFSSPLTAASSARLTAQAEASGPAPAIETSVASGEAEVLPDDSLPVARPARGRRRGAQTAGESEQAAPANTNTVEPAVTDAAAELPAGAEAAPPAPRRRRGRASAPPIAEGGAADEAGAEAPIAPAGTAQEPDADEQSGAGVPADNVAERGSPLTRPDPTVADVSAGEPSAAGEWGVAPASDADLAAIARATGNRQAFRAPSPPARAERADPFPDDEELVVWEPPAAPVDQSTVDAEEAAEGSEDAGAVRRRRRRGRGRRGGAGRNGGQPAIDETEAPASQAPGSIVEQRPAARQPILPDYPVEFEPTPPPTKRRPARRPGMTSDPRFSREEQAEIDQFVRTEPAASAKKPEAAVAPDSLRASLLTAEEEQELARVAPLKGRPRRGRGGAKPAEPVTQESGLTPTPAFEPMPASPGTRAGQSPMEALLTRQNIILDTLMERQISLLRNIERSLIAMDQRLSHAPQGFTNLPRAGVFVDVPNVIYAAERIGCNVDFGKLLALLTKGRELVRASAYAPVSDDPQMRLESQKFVQPFVGRGYRIVTKPLKRFSDGTMKGNFDVELAMDILTMADRLDVVCLVSGDGDFSRLVEIIASKGVRVEVVAFSASTSSELRATCDEYIDLGTRLREICS